jgi:hypothetical protein
MAEGYWDVLWDSRSGLYLTRKVRGWILTGCVQAFDGFFGSIISVWMVNVEGNQHLPGKSHRQWDLLAFTLIVYSSFTKILPIDISPHVMVGDPACFLFC